MANLSELSYKGVTYGVNDKYALHRGAIGSWIPDFKGLDVVETHEFDMNAATTYVVCERDNVTNIADATDVLAFRITVTGTNIRAEADVVVRMQPTVNVAPRVVMEHRSISTAAATTGFRYMYSVYPKAANTNYKYQIAIYPYNATARHVKVEVFKTASAWTFLDTGVRYAYNSTYQTRNDLTVYTNLGLIANYTQYMTTNYANYSGYCSTFSAMLNGSYNFMKAGEALAVYQLCFIGEDDKVYPTTNTTVAINTEWPIFFTPTAFASGATITWSALRTWGAATIDSSVLRDTLAANVTTYLKCTRNISTGKIYSANLMTQSLSGGGAFFKLGMAYSSTVISVSTVNSDYFVLDSAGNQIGIRGRNICAEKVHTWSDLFNTDQPILLDYTTDAADQTWVGKSSSVTANPVTGEVKATKFSGSGEGLTGVIQVKHLHTLYDGSNYTFTDSLTEAEIIDILDGAYNGDYEIWIHYRDIETTKLYKYSVAIVNAFVKIIGWPDFVPSNINAPDGKLGGYYAIAWTNMGGGQITAHGYMPSV